MADDIKTGAPATEGPAPSQNFIHEFIAEDIAPGGRFAGMQVHTRFPPEPNGYLHIGHCKALCIDFGTAEKFGGLCNLRMDDTNPAKEDTEYVDAIQEDIHWLGFDWGDRFFYGSDYFDEDYRQAVGLIKKGLAYVCELTPEQFKEYRGDTTTPARSPWRDRPIEESLDLFERMKNGEFPEGRYTLRAKIDLEFHHQLVLTTENEYLIDMFETLQGTLHYLSIRSCEFVATEQKKDNLIVMGSQHVAICSAIGLGLPELARSAMERHIDFCCSRCLINRTFHAAGSR